MVVNKGEVSVLRTYVEEPDHREEAGPREGEAGLRTRREDLIPRAGGIRSKGCA